MRRLLIVASLLCGVARVDAQPDGTPIRVAIQCEQQGRTKACPAFLAGFVDGNKVLLNSPLAGADVILYATANSVALIDSVHLRFVGQMASAPAPVELDVDLDTRTTDDQQRAALEPVFLRGIALFVATRHPGAVTVTLTVPPTIATATPDVSPWGVELGVAANASYTANYRTAGTQLFLVGRYLTPRFRAFALQTVAASLNRQPPLTLDDGTRVSLDNEQWKYRGGAEAVYSWCDAWSVGVGSYTFFEDPKGQYAYNSRTRAAIEWDLFPADDPRGNRLGVFYHLGWMVERYNIRNTLGERFAHYPSHGIDAVGSVRHDRISYGLNLSSDVQVEHPGRRLLLTASPFASIQIGNHVDLDLSFSVTKRTFPPPDPAAIDPSDFAQLSRLSYAEPLSFTSSIGLTLHWDPTNGVRNNRIESI